jgi:hypothetical protein
MHPTQPYVVLNTSHNRVAVFTDRGVAKSTVTLHNAHVKNKQLQEKSMTKSVEHWWALKKKVNGPVMEPFWTGIDGHPILFNTRALAETKRKSDRHIAHHTRAVKVMLQEE